MRDRIIKATIEAFKSINQERLYKTERGYHGQFYCALRLALESTGVISEELILEMEYQKSSTHHQTSQRPDIVLHIPVEHSGAGVTESNFAVWALKHHRNRNEAAEDFRKLNILFQNLHYPLGFFIVVDSDQPMLEAYSGDFQDRIMSFAVRLSREVILIRQAYFQNDRLVITDANA